MQIEEITYVATADLPSSELADYLQLQSDATGAVYQDQHLDTSLRAAINEIEARTGRVLLRRQFEIVVPPKKTTEFSYGKADNVQINQLFFEDSPNELLLENEFAFVPLKFSSELKLLVSAASSNLIIRFFAGQQYWDDVNADLKLAVLTLAAHFYENRFDDVRKNIGMPKLVDSLLEKHRKLRLLRG